MKKLIAGFAIMLGVLIGSAGIAGACPSQVTEQGGSQLQGYNNSAGCPVPSAGQCGTPAQVPYEPTHTYVGQPSDTTPTTAPCPPKQVVTPPPAKKPCPTQTTTPTTQATPPATTAPAPAATVPPAAAKPAPQPTPAAAAPAPAAQVSTAIHPGQVRVVPHTVVNSTPVKTTGQLATTGVNVKPYGILGGLLVLAGIILLAWKRLLVPFTRKGAHSKK